MLFLYLIIKPFYDISKRTEKIKVEIENLIRSKAQLDNFIKILGPPKYNYSTLNQLPGWEKSFMSDPKGNDIVIFYYEGLPYFKVILIYIIQKES
jgi:hypothetical protein